MVALRGGINDCYSQSGQIIDNIHPGEILLEEFLLPYKLSAYRLAKDLSIPQTRVSQILKGTRSITADTVLRLSQYFGNSAAFWLGLQNDFDLEEVRNAKAADLENIAPFSAGVQ